MADAEGEQKPPAEGEKKAEDEGKEAEGKEGEKEEGKEGEEGKPAKKEKKEGDEDEEKKKKEEEEKKKQQESPDEDLRLEFILNYLTKTMRLKQEKWTKMIAIDEFKVSLFFVRAHLIQLCNVCR